MDRVWVSPKAVVGKSLDKLIYSQRERGKTEKEVEEAKFPGKETYHHTSTFLKSGAFLVLYSKSDLSSHST